MFFFFWLDECITHTVFELFGLTFFFPLYKFQLFSIQLFTLFDIITDHGFEAQQPIA
jgi:hypothetical protein